MGPFAVATLLLVLSVALCVAQDNNYYNTAPYYSEAYENRKMAGLSFSYTGCSVRTTSDSSSSNKNWNYQEGQDTYYPGTYHKPFVTFRLCDQCTSMLNTGCGNKNGDYITSIKYFGRAYSQYLEQANESNGQSNQNGDNVNLFECTNVNQNQQNQEQGDNGDQPEFFVGPACTGNGISLAVFYDNECSYLAENVKVKKVLGYSPNTRSLTPNRCISCNLSQDYNDYGGQAIEINPLCGNLMETSGRCDRDSVFTVFDQFWQDVVDFYEADENQNSQNQDNQYSSYYDQYLGENTCEFIDSLKHAPATWGSLKKEAERHGISTGALAGIIVASISVAAVIIAALFGHFCGRGRCSEREPFLDGSEYHPSHGTQV